MRRWAVRRRGRSGWLIATVVVIVAILGALTAAMYFGTQQ